MMEKHIWKRDLTDKKPRHSGAFSRNREHSSSRLGRNDANELAVFRAFGLKLHKTVAQCEQRVVTTKANACARVETRAALTHDDVTRSRRLATEEFYT
ncbi:hypothetical protein HORIV_03840 [Vreelandella olivaria]|uniref:Uncharacterized protein n=1 Tax=Vreelandella olivaria TaxID=390919 RepID=A0ABN5WLT7_9GAMM|nr:hypothetical protein HORIV_03840 [Halomonas olivaria]